MLKKIVILIIGTYLVNDKRGTEIVTENMFEHLLHFATQAAIQIFFQTCYEYCFTLSR